MALWTVERPEGFHSHAGFNEQWWLPRMHQADSALLAVIEDQVEVARIEMIERTWPGEYVGVTESPDFIKIQFLEVHDRHRNRGIGSETLRLLAKKYPRRRLLAFSEADGFWESTGWSRHVHRKDDPAAPRHQVLFIAPP